MRDIAGAGKVRDLDGVELLDLNAGPYSLLSWSDDEEVAERAVAEPSPWMDGDVGVGWRLLATSLDISVLVEAATWAAVEGAFADLKTALKAAPNWLLERQLEGVSVTWRAERPTSISSPIHGSDVRNLSREVFLRIPVQPSPSVTGLPE